MLISFYLGFFCLHITQSLTRRILYKGEFISDVKTIPFLNIPPSNLLDYIEIWFILFLTIPVLGILFRTFDKKKS